MVASLPGSRGAAAGVGPAGTLGTGHTPTQPPVHAIVPPFSLVLWYRVRPWASTRTTPGFRAVRVPTGNAAAAVAVVAGVVEAVAAVLVDPLLPQAASRMARAAAGTMMRMGVTFFLRIRGRDGLQQRAYEGAGGEREHLVGSRRFSQPVGDLGIDAGGASVFLPQLLGRGTGRGRTVGPTLEHGEPDHVVLDGPHRQGRLPCSETGGPQLAGQSGLGGQEHARGEAALVDQADHVGSGPQLAVQGAGDRHEAGL